MDAYERDKIVEEFLYTKYPDRGVICDECHQAIHRNRTKTLLKEFCEYLNEEVKDKERVGS